MAKRGEQWSSKEHQAHKASHGPSHEFGKSSVARNPKTEKLPHERNSDGTLNYSDAEYAKHNRIYTGE